MESEISESVRSARRSAIPIQAKTVTSREKTGPITRQILSIVASSTIFPSIFFFIFRVGSGWTELPRSYDGPSRSPRSLQGYRFRRGIRFPKRPDKFENFADELCQITEVCNGDREIRTKREKGFERSQMVEMFENICVNCWELSGSAGNAKTEHTRWLHLSKMVKNSIGNAGPGAAN